MKNFILLMGFILISTFALQAQTSTKIKVAGNCGMCKKVIETAKLVYTETSISTKPVSVVSLAYQYLKQLNIPLDARILIVGAGVTVHGDAVEGRVGQTTREHIHQAGCHGSVGGQITEHGGHVGADHARTLGNAGGARGSA